MNFTESRRWLFEERLRRIEPAGVVIDETLLEHEVVAGLDEVSGREPETVLRGLPPQGYSVPARPRAPGRPHAVACWPRRRVFRQRDSPDRPVAPARRYPGGHSRKPTRRWRDRHGPAAHYCV